MASRRHKGRGGGGHSGSHVPEWIVTFADMVALLMAFFVMMVALSVQDQEKVQAVAGSMRDAFGIQPVMRRGGMIEIEGAPYRPNVRQVSPAPTPLETEFANERHDRHVKQGPEANTHDMERTEVEKPRQFAAAAASLRQSFQEMPEIVEISRQIVMEETKEGLSIQIVDQDGRSMFPEGSRHPYERTRAALARMAPLLARMPNRITITGHTTAGRRSEAGASSWELSAERANAVRRVLEEHGLSGDRVSAIIGKADTEPLFPDDPYLASNRRIAILLLDEAPPMLPGVKP